MLYDEVMQSVGYLHTQTERKPAIAIILGSGLGNLVDEMEDTCAIPYTDTAIL